MLKIVWKPEFVWIEIPKRNITIHRKMNKKINNVIINAFLFKLVLRLPFSDAIKVSVSLI